MLKAGAVLLQQPPRKDVSSVPVQTASCWKRGIRGEVALVLNENTRPTPPSPLQSGAVGQLLGACPRPRPGAAAARTHGLSWRDTPFSGEPLAEPS